METKMKNTGVKMSGQDVVTKLAKFHSNFKFNFSLWDRNLNDLQEVIKLEKEFDEKYQEFLNEYEGVEFTGLYKKELKEVYEEIVSVYKKRKSTFQNVKDNLQDKFYTKEKIQKVQISNINEFTLLKADEKTKDRIFITMNNGQKFTKYFDNFDDAVNCYNSIEKGGWLEIENVRKSLVILPSLPENLK